MCGGCLWNTDNDHVLDETKTWAEAELQSESCIVHMRYEATHETVEGAHTCARMIMTPCSTVDVYPHRYVYSTYI